jgi:LmbE family N-acetylglucosaminyl deacetylase
MTDQLEVKNKTILCVGAHADDLDAICAGSVAYWAKQGANIYYLICTDGRRGTDDINLSCDELVEIRIKEQQEAANCLGVKEVFFLGFTDGELENTFELRKELVRFIRKLKPEIVVSWDPTYVYNEEQGSINHPDHRNCGQAVLDSIWPYARNLQSFPDLLDEDLKPHKVREVLLVNHQKSQYFVDITSCIEQKMTAMAAHKSQWTDENLARIKKRCQNLGEKLGYGFAEGFVKISIST